MVGFLYFYLDTDKCVALLSVQIQRDNLNDFRFTRTRANVITLQL